VLDLLIVSIVTACDNADRITENVKEKSVCVAELPVLSE